MPFWLPQLFKRNESGNETGLEVLCPCLCLFSLTTSFFINPSKTYFCNSAVSGLLRLLSNVCSLNTVWSYRQLGLAQRLEMKKQRGWLPPKVTEPYWQPLSRLMVMFHLTAENWNVKWCHSLCLWKIPSFPSLRDKLHISSSYLVRRD